MIDKKILIDASALIEKVKGICEDSFAFRCSQHSREFAKDIADAVKKAPTVDAVEVVRCKECEFGEWGSTHRYKTQDGNTAEMSLYECLFNRSQRRWHAGTHFCSYGKPKKETREPVPCSECKHRMWSDHYAECSKGQVSSGRTILAPTEKGEPMVDCKKCLHAPVCEKLPKMPGAIIAECAEFKDCTKWVERPKGRWIYHECVSSHDGAISGYSCSQCHGFVNEEAFDMDEFHKDFCGNCGADMRGESE